MYTYTFIYKVPPQFSYLGKVQMAFVDLLVDRNEDNHLAISILSSKPQTLVYRQHTDFNAVQADLKRQAMLAVMREQNIPHEKELVATFH